MSYKDGEAGWITGQGVPDSWRSRPGGEHVAHLQRMANEAWIGSPERAALDAAIAALSAPPPAEAQAQGGGDAVRSLLTRWAQTYKPGVSESVSLLIHQLAHALKEGSRSAPPSAPVGVEVPFGAIENGRIFADRLEAHPFESQGGDLRFCSDWQEFRRCFDYLAEWASALAQQPAAVDEAMVEQVASAIAIEDTGVSWHDVSPRDRTYYVRLARAALAAQQGGEK